jgi:hypothetical protein
MLDKNRKHLCKKLTSVKLVLRTTIMTPVKPHILKFKADEILPSWALMCYGGSTHDRLLSESSRPHILAYYLFLYILLLCIGGEVIIVSMFFNLMSAIENIML